MNNKELLDDRHSYFVLFCSCYGLTKKKKYAGKIMDALDYDEAQKVLGLSRPMLEKYWNKRSMVSDSIITLMRIHTGQDKRLCDIYETDYTITYTDD